MAKFRCPHSESVHVPWLGTGRLVNPAEIVTVPEGMADGFREAGWEEVVPLARPKKVDD